MYNVVYQYGLLRKSGKGEWGVDLSGPKPRAEVFRAPTWLGRVLRLKTKVQPVKMTDSRIPQWVREKYSV